MGDYSSDHFDLLVVAKAIFSIQPTDRRDTFRLDVPTDTQTAPTKTHAAQLAQLTGGRANFS